MAGKNVFADGSNVYVKNNSTEFQVVGSTGQLYHQGIALSVTPAVLNNFANLTFSTEGKVLYTTQANVNVTAPTSQINVLGVVTWPSTAAHTLVATTVTQDLTNKTLNAGSSPSTASHTLVATTVAQTLENKTLGANTVRYTETGSTAANLVNYGVSLLPYSTDSNTYTLAAPAVGVEKILAMQSVSVPDATAKFAAVYTGSTATLIMDNSTAYAPKLFVGLQPPYSYIRMVGLTTAIWGIDSIYGGTKLSTAATFTT